MSTQYAVTVECYGTVQRIPLQNPYITIDKFKDIVCSRLKINYPFNLTYQGADLCNEDTVHDLAIHPTQPIRVRRQSIESYAASSMTDVFLSYERTHREVIKQLKQRLEEKTYLCWLDIEQIPDNDQFCPAVEQGIQKSTVFVCCITRRYVVSSQCQQELRFAKQSHKPIVLLLMEVMNWPPSQIESLVSGLSYIEFYSTTSSASLSSWSPEKFDALLNKLSELAPQM